MRKRLRLSLANINKLLLEGYLGLSQKLVWRFVLEGRLSSG